MGIMFWLKEGVEIGQELQRDVSVKTRKTTGSRFMQFDVFILDPGMELPDVPQELISHVTYRDIIYEGFRTSGLYCHKGAELTARMDCTVGNIETAYQIINIKGPDFVSVKEIFSLFRQGKLQAAEDWEAPQEVPQEVTQVRRGWLSSLWRWLRWKR